VTALDVGPGRPPTTSGVRKVASRVFNQRFLPVAGSVVVLLILLAVCQTQFSARKSFISVTLFRNLLLDNSYLLVLGIGMTFAIITGGIDLSMGAVVALVGMELAVLLQAGVALPFALLCAVATGTAVGLVIGILVQVFDVQPFMASLIMMLAARGTTYLLSTQAIPINHEGFSTLSKWGKAHGLPDTPILIALTVMVLGFVILHYTRFGRTVYALGQGDGGSAVNLMGLHAARAKYLVYLISGTCSGLGGIVYTMYKPSGDPTTGVGMELDVIAAVVIGGTLLTGGVGFALGTGVGVVLYGLIRIVVGRLNLSSWWAIVVTAAVLLVFVILQKAVTKIRRT